MECPKCGYVRRPSDHAPEWQCPSCGVAYNKVSNSPESDSEDSKVKPPSAPIEKDHWAIALLGGILLLVFAYFNTLDGDINHCSAEGTRCKEYTREDEPYFYLIYLSIQYFAGAYLIAHGLFKYLKSRRKK